MKPKSFADAEANLLAGSPASASWSAAAGPTVILFPLNRYAAAYPVDDASSLDEDVFELGELAVRLVGNFSLPRIHCELVATDSAWEE